jgi:hypothetical protein
MYFAAMSPNQNHPQEPIMTTKSVDYAYPTSPNACLFGYGASGCYVVKIGPADYSRPHEAVAGFADKQAAFDAADARPEPYDSYSLRTEQ